MKETIDYTRFHEKGTKPPPSKIEGPIHQWWKAEKKDLPMAVLAQVDQIIKNDRSRIDRYNTYVKLYGNHSLATWKTIHSVW